jgi:hypothetical protein
VAPLLQERQQVKATDILAPLNDVLPNTDPRWNGIVEDIKTYQINTLPEAAQRRWIKSQADRISNVAEPVTKRKPKTTETTRKTKAKAKKRRGGRRGNAASSTQAAPAPGMDLDQPFDVEAVAAHFSQK